ncbi:MAG: PIN domain-containing protein [Bacteroidales bacterium]|nr:PIN domain-containing protein [Bacteroidales bacterium]
MNKDIANLNLLNINQKTCEIFLELMTKFSLSHKLALPDGFIAATAIASDIELFTLNIKDYKFINELKLYKS